MKFIVTTTINEPTAATLKFCELTVVKDDWTFLIIGDTKTPHQSYRKLEVVYPHLIYLDPEEQEALFPALSAAIGWRKIQRRNIGFVYAYAAGAEVIATVDDDNIPYDNWGEDVKVGQEITYDGYRCTASDFFDPLAPTQTNYLWHRGYPIEHLQTRHQIEALGPQKKQCLVQANLWDGDPDIDAMARLTHRPIVDYKEITAAYGSEQIAPFNSQNTLLHRSVIPYYAVLPFVGRMDDIWGAYILQHHFPNAVVYDVATVYQDRNEQDLITNLENEILGYRQTLKFLEAGEDYVAVLPEAARKFWESYRAQFTDLSLLEKSLHHFQNKSSRPCETAR
ncbi:MAG: hypothetical protein SynsKO_05600 [Synoicihabitans sp.]